MLALAMTSHHLIAGDVYAYIGYAKLGLHQAYSPPRQFRSGPGYEPINRVWGEPMIPCVYGPIWLAAPDTRLRLDALACARHLRNACPRRDLRGVAIVIALNRLGVSKETCTICGSQPCDSYVLRK